MRLDVYSIDNEKVDTIELPNGLFEYKWKPELVHQAVTAILANRRTPVAHTKDRSEVRGGGKKPWRQKGTGRARHGSIRSPLWTGGGVTFGPRKEKIYAKKISKKMKQAALLSAISKKIKDGEVKIVNFFNFEKPKTGYVTRSLEKLIGKNKKKNVSVLLVPEKGKREIFLAGRNISKTDVQYPNSLNVYDCSAHKFIIFERNAVSQLTEQLTK